MYLVGVSTPFYFYSILSEFLKILCYGKHNNKTPLTFSQKKRKRKDEKHAGDKTNTDLFAAFDIGNIKRITGRIILNSVNHADAHSEN